MIGPIVVVITTACCAGASAVMILTSINDGLPRRVIVHGFITFVVNAVICGLYSAIIIARSK